MKKAKFNWEKKLEEILRTEIGGYFFEYDEETTKIDDKDPIFSRICKVFSQELKREREEVFKIADEAILRMQIVGVELSRRMKDPEANKLLNDIRGKYEELKSKKIERRKNE